MDIVDAAKRSSMMSAIRSRDTKPEMQLRRRLSAQGLRYRLHRKDLPGRPDLAFVGRRAVIFVNGCFWHGHDCHLFTWPKTRTDFWADKIGRNRERDQLALRQLSQLGWRALTVWECALRGRGSLGEERVAQEAADWVRKGTGFLHLRGTS